MLNRIRDRFGFTRKLGFRLGGLLSVAILPFALISFIQSFNLVRAAEQSIEIALVGRTQAAAAGERALLQSALASADALGAAVLDKLDDPIACSRIMRSFIQHTATYTTAAYMPMNGRTGCTSGAEGNEVDVSGKKFHQQFVEEPATLVTAIDASAAMPQSVVIAMQPLYRDRELLGYIALSLTDDLMNSTHDNVLGAENAHIVTFNHRGDVISVDDDNGRDNLDFLPRDLDLVGLLSRTDTTFRAVDQSGEARVFQVVPVVPGLVYALGSWSPKAAGAGFFGLSRVAAVLMPLALWLVTLAVAYFAVFRMVLRHITVLRGQMRRFAIGSRSEAPPVLTHAPAEIADVSQTFHNMARILIRDEEAMERSVAEKTVLLKEVHHRVKNNLQLIASIINMQGRLIDYPDAKIVLRSVQDRVAALAAIYRNIYQAEHLDAVEAGRLISDIVNQMSSASIGTDSDLRIETDIEPLTLLPDQAVPLSLLATEAFTNALKYTGKPPGGERPYIRISLMARDQDKAVLEIVNSMGERPDIGEGTGLGAQLIEAFAMQLEGNLVKEQQGDEYVVRLSFGINHGVFGDSDDIRSVVLTSAAREGAEH